MTSLERAMAIVAAARPEERAKIEMHRAVADVDFVREAARKPPQPSFAGQSPVQTELLERQQRAHEDAQRRELQARERRADSLEAEIRTLQAGQSEANRALIRSTVNQG